MNSLERARRIAQRITRGGDDPVSIEGTKAEIKWLQDCTGLKSGSLVVDQLSGVSVILHWFPGGIDVSFPLNSEEFLRRIERRGKE